MSRSFFCLLIFFLTFSCREMDEALEENPNIILVITDDQGYGDLGFHGNPYIKTPFLDRFAQQSTRITNFYVSPVCAPTRSSIMTGRYSLRTGVYDTYNGGAIMSTEETTIAEWLHSLGYRTGIFGKWHLGDTYPHRPQDQGFDKVYIHPSGGMGQVGDVFNYFDFDSSYFDSYYFEDGERVQAEGYCSDVFTHKAVDFIRENQEAEPFFLYLAFNAPHTPLQVPSEYYDMYRDLEFNDTLTRSLNISNGDAEAARKIYGMVTNIDDNLSRIDQLLDSLGILNETIMIFMTDNGPQQTRYNAGLRGLKSSVYEGGTRVPFFIRWPGRLDENREVHYPGAHFDLFPTLAGLLGRSLPDSLILDGTNLADVLLNRETDPPERTFFSYWQRGYPEPYWNIAVREGNFKLIGNGDQNMGLNEYELFNIDLDPSENINLIEHLPDKAESLKMKFDSFYNEIVKEPNLIDPPRIAIGSDKENPVILNRNDAKKAGGIWAEDRVYAYWDVDVLAAGEYEVKCSYRVPPGLGRVFVRIGTIQRSIRNQETGKQDFILSLPLLKGPAKVEAWFIPDEGPYIQLLPFYLELHSAGQDQ